MNKTTLPVRRTGRRFSTLGCIFAFACLSGCMQSGRGRIAEAVFAPASVVFMGDSVTLYWGPGQQGQSDAFVVNANWINKGAYGETSGQMLARFPTDVLALKPALVHILAGTNDVYPGWVLCGGVQNVDTCGNIKAMVAMARAAGIQVILSTIPPWGPGDAAKGFDPSPDRYNRINQLNQWIEQFSADNDLTVADYHTLLVAADGEMYKAGLTVDGIHPTPQAYALMTPLAKTAISDAQRK
jgi:lysophospholipase L1-like esterase